MRYALAVLAALAVAGCGSTPTTPTPAPTPAPAGSQAVVLDSGNFDSRVLASGRASLVEFQLPT